MDKPTLYIDQNIIGLCIEGAIDLPKSPDFYWVYSKEHFAEIRRAANVNQYLAVLDGLGAKLLDLEYDSNFRITGRPILIENGSPFSHYELYLQDSEEVAFNDHVLDPFLAWIYGGSDEDSFRGLPEEIFGQLNELSKNLPDELVSMLGNIEDVKSKFAQVIDRLVQEQYEFSMLRETMGGGKGAVGSVDGDAQILKIWALLEPVFPGVTCEQFFGFDPIDKQGYESWPIYLGIIGCCAVMDLIGFQAEKKRRRIDKVPNIRSDAHHIAMGAFCSAILSEDKRLIGRASAIYEYKGIGAALLIERRVAGPVKFLVNVSNF